MLSDFALPLTVALVVAAVVCLVAAIWLLRRLGDVRRGLEAVTGGLDTARIQVPERLRAARASLAEQGASAEHVLWSMRRFDEDVETLTANLARRRETLADLRQTLRGARVGVERLKQALRLITRAIELRRDFLG